jgi:hypothetical protein
MLQVTDDGILMTVVMGILYCLFSCGMLVLYAIFLMCTFFLVKGMSRVLNVLFAPDSETAEEAKHPGSARPFNRTI